MAINTTTLTSAIGLTDQVINVSSATGFAAGDFVKVDEEFMQVQQVYTSGTAIPVLRAKNGTAQVTHQTSANVVVGLGSDFTGPSATTVVSYGLSARRRKVISYSASGALDLPLAGEDIVWILNGTSTLSMTLAVPGTDLDGAVGTMIGNGKSASAVAVSGTTGIGGGGSGYENITFQNGAQVAVQFMACNGVWVLIGSPVTGTTTKIDIAVS